MKSRYFTGAPSFMAGWNFQVRAARSNAASYAGLTLFLSPAEVTAPVSSIINSSRPRYSWRAITAFGGRQTGMVLFTGTGLVTDGSSPVYTRGTIAFGSGGT